MSNFDEFVDGTTALDQIHLDGLVPAQMSYLVSAGGIPGTSASLVLTQPAITVVLNDGTQARRAAISSTTVNCGAGGVAQDNYVDVNFAGTFTVSTVAANAAAPAVAANSLRLYKATTNAGNTAVVSVVDLANRSAIGAGQPLGVATLDANGKVVQSGQVTPAVMAARTSNVLAASGWNAIPMDTTINDSLAPGTPQHSTSVNTSRLTVVQAGYYQISATVFFSAIANGTVRGAKLTVNSTTDIAIVYAPVMALSAANLSQHWFMRVGDYVELSWKNDSTDVYGIDAVYPMPSIAMERVA